MVMGVCGMVIVGGMLEVICNQIVEWILGMLCDFLISQGLVCVFDLVNIVYFIEMSIELDVVWMDK